MAVNIQLIKELRERTQAAMMECKKALVDCDGDIEKAIDYLKKQGQIKAEKKSSRVASQGFVAVETTGKKAVIVEVNCETDFVSGGEDFAGFCQQVANIILEQNPKDVAELSAATFDNGTTVDAQRVSLIAKLGENIQIRRFIYHEAKGHAYVYTHGGHVAAIVDISVDDEVIGKDLAMHVTASAPLALVAEDVPSEVVEREKAIIMERAQDTGNPEAMMKGALKKFLAEMSLNDQVFIKDSKKTIKQLLQDNSADIYSFHRLEMGEGIEKEDSNFVEEVMAQVKGED